MLSAIAARKAAQAAKASTENVVNQTQASESAESTPSASPPPSKHPSKRKSSETRPPTHSAKRRKGGKDKPVSKTKPPRPTVKHARYFAEQNDEFEDQDDVILVDSEAAEESDAQEMSEEPDMDVAPTATRREWSPGLPLNDSSDDEEPDDAFMHDIEDAVPSDTGPKILSSFRPIPDQNAFYLQPDEVSKLRLSALEQRSDLPGTVLALGPEDTLCLLGTYTFCVLHGSIRISGVDIAPSKRIHHVFSPKSSPLPMLEGNLSDVDTRIFDDASLPERLRPLVRSSVALVLVQELRTGVEGLGRVCRTFENPFEPSKWQQDANLTPLLQLPGVHLVSHQMRDVQEFVLPVTWQAALSSRSLSPSDSVKPGIYVVKGPKKSGKSTFARTLLNTLLTKYRRVAYLDCDPGQSEFAPAGLVTLNVVNTLLFGPPFTHPTLPNFAHYIGASTPRSSPSHYLECIQSLLASYRLEVQIPCPNGDDDDEGDERISQSIPLVVNTMGWTKGLGADLNRKIEEMVEPTHVFEVELPPRSTFDVPWRTPLHTLPAAPATARMLTLEPASSSILTTSYSAADHRALSILSYFFSIFPSRSASDPLRQHTATRWDATLPLCAKPPYEVDCTHTFGAVVLLEGTGGADVVPSEVWRVLNGAVVGIVKCDPGTVGALLGSGADSSVPYKQGAGPPSPSASQCVGLALIRSVSPPVPSSAQGTLQMHILTPLPAAVLASLRRDEVVLVKGELELPVWGLLDFRSLENGGDVAGVEKSRVPYLQWGKSEGVVGGEKRRVRRNLMRRGQM